ncbi:DEAD/DEAH box helicase [Microbacterium sp. STN6]|uniref:DEAD/DEAH box helicase n=1 Tax=Microbacterium sp. STN6 TaxID=2995588 RepID=UPI002260FA87|nr:DEAD/DEAH box helicase [Microbacterium sp. STN6]MCX7522993.1 DEAD/DEAH box helicase [Microbacterium sp. STN6]
MPNFKKTTGKKSYGANASGNKSFGAKGGPKSGSRSPGHRGFRADETGAPKKQRWNAEERAARAAGGHSTDRRPNWEPRGTNDRPAYGDRGGRGERSYGDRPNRGDRPAYGDRPNRGERPAYGDRPNRGDRPAYGDRPNRGERPSYGDRPNRGDRPSYGDRPNRDDRAPRRDYSNDRPQRSYDDRGDRAPRRDFGNDRPQRSFDRDRAPRRDFDNDRAPRRSFDDRAPRRDFGGDRPQRSFDRAPRRDFDNDRPRRDFSNDRPRRDFDNDRPRRNHDDRPRTGGSDSAFYPSREDKPRFTAQDDVVLERLEAEAIEASDVEGVSFGDLGLGGNIVRALADLGAASPFPIQAATIPDVLAGKDVLGRGRTGSGKTIAFGAPLVERLMALWAAQGKSGGKRQLGRKPRALILAPTRELALQIDRTVQPIARSVGLFTTQIYGGVPQHRQVGALQRGVDIVIGTPGRIEDLIEQGRLDLSEVVITVLDEADHMCDLGFLEPVQRILRHTADGGQKLLFSATLDKGVAQLVDEFLPSPAVHEVAGEDQASSTIDHHVLVVEHRDKAAIIEQLADREGKTLIFSRTRAYAEQLADQLEDAGVRSTSLHGDLNQSRRTRNLALLTSGRVRVLVATDVAARGIHVDDIDLVIQADAPDEYKTYLHRAGRTGRAGKPGTVVTLIPKQRRRRMDDMLGRAEIEAVYANAYPGDQILSDLGAADEAPEQA